MWPATHATSAIAARSPRELVCGDVTGDMYRLAVIDPGPIEP